MFVAATIGLGAVLADDRPFTVDEAVSANVVDRSFGGMVHVLWSQERLMWPFHVALWFWARLGDSDQWLRMLSVLGGAVGVWFFHRLVARWTSPPIAVLSCVILIANPFFLRYLVDARAYSWTLALTVVCVDRVDLMLRRDRGSDAAVLGVTAGLALLCHFLSALVLAALLLSVWVAGRLDRRLVRRLLLPAAIAVALVVPWVVAFVTHSDATRQSRATVFRVAAETSSAWGSLPTSVLIAIGLVGCSAALWPMRRTWSGLSPVLLAVVPVALLALLSLVKPLFLDRYLLPALPFAAAALAISTGAVPGAVARNVAYGLVGAMVVLASAVTSLEVGPGPDALAEFLDERVRSGDVVVFEPSYLRPYVERYWDDQLGADVALIGYDDAELLPATRSLDEIEPDIRAADTAWLVIPATWSIDEVRPGSVPVSTQSFGFAKVVRLCPSGVTTSACGT